MRKISLALVCLLLCLIVKTNAQTSCGSGFSLLRLYTGYGIDYTTVNSVTNPARAMGIPNTTRYALLVHNASASSNGQITITLANTVAQGDTVKIIASGSDANSVGFTVSVSADNVTYSPTSSMSVAGTTMNSLNYIVGWSAGAKYIRIKNSSTTRDLRLDAVSYVYKTCFANCIGGVISYISGNAIVPLNTSTCTNPTYSCGGCNNTGSTQTSAQLLVVDLGQVVPYGTKIQCFLASSSATTAAAFTVSSSLSNTTYVDAQSISAKILQPDYAGYTYTVMQPGGIRYVKFQTTGSANGYVDAVTFQFPAYWGKDYITGTVFYDVNFNGVKDGTETGAAGINLKLYKDVNHNGVYDAQDIFKQSLNTTAGGTYTFQITQNDTNYVVVLNNVTLPAGMNPNTAAYQTAVFTEMNKTDCGNDFGYRPCPGNCPPIAVNDYTTTVNGTAVYIPVLSNDYDPNNDINPSSLTVLHQPSQGTVLISNSQIIYTPIGSFSGIDTFTYIISDLTSPTPLSDTATVIITVISAISSVCDAAVLSHSYYIPALEKNIRKAFAKMDCHSSGAVTDSMRNIISIKIPYPGCIITYDHWEDGYESNSSVPSQNSTQVWGDGNIYNGIAPGYPNDIIPAGGSIILINMIGDTSHYAGLIKYDAGDKIISNEDIAVSRVGYDKNRQGLQTYSVDVYDTHRFGTDFIVPFGQDINQTRDFQYTGMFIRASENGTIISIDKNSDNIIDITATLNEGEEYFVNNGVKFGANVASTKPIGVDVIFGDTTDCWNAKTLNILPAAFYSNLYYSPVPTTHSPDSCAVMFYNPVAHPITINWTNGANTGSFSVGAQNYKRMNLTLNATYGYKFQSAAGEEFVANELVDAWSQNPATNSGATYNWAFALIPESRLTNFFSVAWAPGSTDGTQNGSPVWVMSPNPTTIYVKYDGNLAVGGTISPNGFHYDVAYNLASLQYKKIFDNADKDQSGLAVFTTDGNKIFGVWGEDPATAGTAYPYLDAGTSIQPLCADRRVFANDDYAITAIGQPVTIAVTSNDAGWLTTLDYNSVSTAGQLQPHHGTVTVYPGGSVSYQPDSGFVGLDTFQYNICSIDISLLCDNALVIVNVTGCGAGLNQINLSGQVFNDVNGNAISDDGGLGFSNVKIRLYQDLNCNQTLDASDAILDSTVTNASGSYQFLHNPEHTIADNFDGAGGTTSCNSGTDGTDVWGGNWVFTGLVNSNCAASSFSADDVITVSDMGDYALRIKDNNKTATRLLNLSNATQAFLSFDFRRGTNFSNGSNVKVQMSANGGTAWTTIYTIAGNSAVDAAYIPVQNLNILPYVSNNTEIRFLTSNNLGDANYVYIDNISIHYLKYPICFITKVVNSTIPANYILTTSGQGTYTANGSGCASVTKFGIRWTLLSIAGKLFDDANGNTDNLINGIGTGVPSSTIIYAYLVDNTNHIVMKDTVNNNGTYALVGSQNTNYTVVLSSSNVGVGAVAPAVAGLPAGWVSTGDGYGTHNGAGTGIEAGIANMSIPLNTGTQNVAALNFGIELVPVAVNNVAAGQVNPGGTNNIAVTPSLFIPTDVDGTVDNIKITAFPANCTTITINGTTYTSGTFPVGGVIIPATGGIPSLPISVDPIDGNISVAIPYQAIDNAGVPSSNTAAVILPFVTVTLAGNVFDDANGLLNFTVDGAGTNIGGTLYANLIDGSNNVASVVGVTSTGMYIFNNVNAGSYIVQISTVAGTVGSFMPSTTLPSNWLNTGEYLGIGAGNDGNVDGVLSVSVFSTNVTDANFGIEQLPFAVTSTLPSQVNPGGTNNITITNSFSGTDPDGSVTQIHIISFPSNVTSITIGSTTYTSGTFPVGGVTAAIGTAIAVDPVNGAVTVVVPYRTVDNAGKESASPASVTLPFTDIWISGYVWDDANGLTDNMVNGTGTNASGSLYMTLVNGTGTTIISVIPVAANGFYMLTSANGVQANTDFKLVLTTNPAGSLTTTLPSNWVNTGEHQFNSAGSDGTIDGVLSVHVFSITLNNDCNHGIEQRPVSSNTSVPSQANPGGTISVPVAATLFAPTDADGSVSSITITSFPSNATTITINGTAYTSASFPVAGVTIPVNGSGNPTQPILVDPIDGSISVVINYVSTDNANVISGNTGSVTLPFFGISISGNVYDDGNGTTDNLINGTGVGSAGSQQLYANLVNHATGLVAGVMAVNTNGSYSFNVLTGVLPNTTFDIVVSTTQGVIGNSVSAVLPVNWVNTAEGTTGTGDGTVNGLTTINVVTSDIAGINFGIEQLPFATAATLSSQVNPGGTNNVNITGSFNGTDADGNVSQIHIISFPTNVTSITIGSTTFTSGTFPVGGITVPTGTTVTIDPVNGAVIAVIPFKTIDNAGKESTASANVNVPFEDLFISGTVFDDANGLTDNTVNGFGSNASGILYVALINTSNNTIVAVAPLPSNGTYNFGTADGVQINTIFNIVLTTNPSGAYTSSLPAAWAHVGEHIGTGAGNDGSVDGVLPVNVGTSTINNADLAGDLIPVAGTNVQPSQVNPGGTTSVTVPANAFNPTDADGIVSSITITSFPSNATTITINGITYTSGTFPGGGVVVPVNGSGQPIQTISVDPVNGTVNVVINYIATDNANENSANTGSVTLPFTDIAISGIVYDDANGTYNGLIDGVAFNNPENQQLYANLINHSTGLVVGSVAVAANGTYSFATADGLQINTNFDVAVSIVQGVIGSAANTSISSLWVNTAEGTTGTGDGSADGITNISVVTSSISNINFGLDKRPTANNFTQASQPNPGGTGNVNVPPTDFTGGDFEGVVDSIRIISFPTGVMSFTINGITYTSSTFPAGGVNIPANSNSNPLQLISFNPNNGNVTVTITFKTRDNAGKESLSPGVVHIPLTDLFISGTVYNDPDGDTNGQIDGTPINSPAGQPLYANLVFQSNNLVAGSIAVAANGTYNMGTAHGVQTNTNFYVVVSTIHGVNGQTVSAVLPTGWVNTGEGFTGVGDGTPNGSTAVSVVTTSVTGINFGIELVPTANDFTEQSHINPGGNNFVNVHQTDFTGSDVDGVLSTTIKITSFPSNTDKLKIDTTTYSSGNFPVGGVNVSANASGNPTQNISIDPSNGPVTVIIPYVTIDNANRQSLAPAHVNIPFSDLGVAGNIYDDANGTYNGLIDGTLINIASGNQLYANLVNHSTGNVDGAVPVSVGGSYSMTTYEGIQINTTYDIVLSTTFGTIGSPVSAVLPTNWVNTAEGQTNPGDGTTNGLTQVHIDTSSINGINFGVDQLPGAGTYTEALHMNPGGTNTVTVAATDFSGSDADGVVDSIRISVFPSNVTSITINGNNYTSGSFPVGGVSIPANSNGQPSQPILIDPVNGNVTVDIAYYTRDNAGKESLSAGAVHIPFVNLTLGGTVFDDANGIYNGLIDGTGIGTASTYQIYANLVNHTTGNVVGVVAVDGSGNYSFDGSTGLQMNTGFDVVVAPQQGTIGSPVTVSWPAGWLNTAEGMTGMGDGTVNSLTNVNMVITSITGVNFGIEQRPTANNYTAASQFNPGLTNNLSVAATYFTGSDADGVVDTIRITSFPSNITTITINGITYNSTSFPASGVNIPAGSSANPLQSISIDPVDGAVTVDIPFVSRDNAGKESTSNGVVHLPLQMLSVGGTVYDDQNGVNNSLIDGTGFNTVTLLPLYANLINHSTGIVLNVKPVNANGTYSFSEGMIFANTSYDISISTIGGVIGTPISANVLPLGWVNTAEGTIGTGDGIANGYTIVNIVTSPVSNADFGLDKKPTGNSFVGPTKPNPGGVNYYTIPATYFSGSDYEGIVSSIRIASFPAGTTSLMINGTAYTSATFPVGGVSIPTVSNGNMSQVIKIDPSATNVTTLILTFFTMDNAGKESLTSNTVTLPFGITP